MNEAETRAEHIDPALQSAGWGVVEGSRIRREYKIAPGRIEGPAERVIPAYPTPEALWARTIPAAGEADTPAERAAHARVYINISFSTKQQAFLDFVLQHYVAVGVEELDPEKLTPLLLLKYHNSIADAVADLGGQPAAIFKAFTGFLWYKRSEN